MVLTGIASGASKHSGRLIGSRQCGGAIVVQRCNREWQFERVVCEDFHVDAKLDNDNGHVRTSHGGAYDEARYDLTWCRSRCHKGVLCFWYHKTGIVLAQCGGSFMAMQSWWFVPNCGLARWCGGDVVVAPHQLLQTCNLHDS